MLFSAFVTLAMACAASVLQGRQALRAAESATSGAPPREMLTVALFGAFLGLAVLAKGPAGALLAGGALALWAFATSQWRTAFRLVHPAAIGAFCIVALPWLSLIHI